MSKGTLIFLVLMQGFVFSGPICGNEVRAPEAMACCKKGHMDHAGPALGAGQANDPCNKCDMGKVPAKRRPDHLPIVYSYCVMPQLPASDTSPGAIPFADQWSYQKASSSDPPELFLLNQSFLI